jgi:hypothetical protein
MAEAADNLDESAASDDGAAEGVDEQNQDQGAQGADEGKSPGTIGDGTNDGANDNVVHATWPEDWRDRLAGNDEKLRSRLNRFTEPENVVKSWLNAEKKISSGQFRSVLPENPTDEQVAAWRAENGIPTEWTEYSSDLPDGVVWGEEDKTIIDGFLEHAHQSNIPQEHVTNALAWYNQLQEDQSAAQANSDLEQKTNNMVTLKEDWGDQYQGNLNAIRGALDLYGEVEVGGEKVSFTDYLYNARGVNGGLLGNDAVVLKALADMALKINPAASIAPGSVDSSLKTINERIAEIESFMSKDRMAYFRDENMQKEFGELLQKQADLQQAAG